MIDRPIIVTCGDPAGIGPEVVQKAWNELRGAVPMCMIADPRFLPLDLPYVVINDPAEAMDHCATALPILSHSFREVVELGHPSLSNAHDVVHVLERGVQLVQQGLGHALCTAPIAKSVLQKGADFKHPGHTEFLAHLDQKTNVVMMLASPYLRVVPTTIHIPIEQVPNALTPELLETTIRITLHSLTTQFGIAKPRMAIAGLNPHAGEDGRIGTEDDAIIRPVIDKLQAEGMLLTGPHPADTLFHARARAKYDAAIAMYHDQALPVLKALSFGKSINITLGIPIIRTSVDHGVALDVAGTGNSDPSSLIEAFKTAQRLI